MKFVSLIIANLFRKKLRTTLTFLSILIAFVLYGYLVAIRAAFGAGVTFAGADRLVVRNKVSLIQLIPVSYKDRIQRIPGVRSVVHSTWFGGYYQKPANFFAQMPVNPKEYLDIYPEVLLSDKEKQAWMSTRTGCILGRKTAEKFGFKVGDRIPITPTIWEKPNHDMSAWVFDIVGIFDGATKATDTSALIFRYDYFDETRAYKKGEVGWYIIRVKDSSQSERIAKDIDREFANSECETKAETEKAFVQGFARQVGDIGKIMIAILSAVFFTILLVAGNTMAQAVRERREELGVLKALGFTNMRVLVLVLVESCALAGTAGVLGLGLSKFLVSLGDPTNGALPLFYFPMPDFLLGFAIVLALGFLSGIGPAVQAMRLNMADALRRM
ncbi:MAG: ytrF [Verrucomicrobiales bacterium]|nr:ytrF [Verrucomicrobiales bacterium]